MRKVRGKRFISDRPDEVRERALTHKPAVVAGHGRGFSVGAG